MSNEDARRRRLLQRRVCAVVLAGVSALLIALFFLPYVTFELSKVTYQFTSLQLVTSFMTVKGTAVSMSLITKAAAVLPLLLAAAGGRSDMAAQAGGGGGLLHPRRPVRPDGHDVD